MKEMEEAIINRDFPQFAKLTMLDSDHFHELCRTTVPPIYYMNDVSRNIVELVNRFNSDSINAAYTFDAGPNAVIYIKKDSVPAFLSSVLHYFPPSTTEKYFFCLL